MGERKAANAMGRYMRRMRESCEMSQDAVGRAMGVSYQLIHTAETKAHKTMHEKYWKAWVDALWPGTDRAWRLAQLETLKDLADLAKLDRLAEQLEGSVFEYLHGEGLPEEEDWAGGDGG